LQWVLNAYLLTLSALMLLGGALGDRFSRVAVFRLGALGFAVSTIGCAIAPNVIVLDVARFIQGVAGALLVPNSLAMLEDAYHGEARATAIGRWAAWSSVSTAAGPLVGGWVADTVSWRWVFAAVVPFALAAAALTWRHEPSTGRRRPTTGHIDYLGAALVTLGMGGVVAGLVEGPRLGFGEPMILGALIGGAALLVAFVLVEARSKNPILPLDVFRSRAFTGANLFTLCVYAALSGLIFLLMLELQNVLGYSALIAGASLLPVNALMLVLSPQAGRLAERIGARTPMTVGALVVALGMALFTRVGPGGSYVTTLLPALIVFGVGLSALVAPLTASVLAAVDDARTGLASAVNNSVARLAGLLATSALPLAAGLTGEGGLRGETLTRGFHRAMWICAALSVIGAVIAWLTVRGKERNR
jgi:EmrB/QacA subfamily drug resistance transporter